MPNSVSTPQTRIHYPSQYGCLKTMPQWVLRLNTSIQVECGVSQLSSNASITTYDTEVVLKIVIGRVSYRAQRCGNPNTYCLSVADRLSKHLIRHPLQGVV